MKPVNVDRVATVKATGRRFVVRNLTIPRDKNQPIKVHCYRNIVRARSTLNGGANWKYDDTIVFLKDAVEIEEKKLSYEFIRELFIEGQVWVGAERGELVFVSQTRTGRTTKIERCKVGAGQLLNAAASAEKDGKDALAELYFEAAERAENEPEKAAPKPAADRGYQDLCNALQKCLIDAEMTRIRREKKRQEKFAADEWEAERRANL